MPIASINVYMDQLQARMSEMKLLMADTTMIPHAKESDRRSALDLWRRTVRMKSHDKIRPASAARLKLMGIGVEHV
jgi:hypothetical protein